MCQQPLSLTHYLCSFGPVWLKVAEPTVAVAIFYSSISVPKQTYKATEREEVEKEVCSQSNSGGQLEFCPAGAAVPP